jgi:hypothetical protein
MKYGILLWFQCVTDGWVLPVNVNRDVALSIRPFQKKHISKYSSKYSSKESEQDSIKDPSKDPSTPRKGQRKILSKEVSNYNDWLLGSNNTGIDTRLEPDSIIILNTTEKELFRWLDWFYVNEKVKILENPNVSINEKLEKTDRSYIRPFNLLNGLWNEFADNRLLL